MEAQTVPPCETLLLLVQCSKTSTTRLLTRSHGDTEAHPPHSTAQNPSSVPPCLRVKPAPVSTVLKDPHDAMLTRSHGDTEAHPS